MELFEQVKEIVKTHDEVTLNRKWPPYTEVAGDAFLNSLNADLALKLLTQK